MIGASAQLAMGNTMHIDSPAQRFAFALIVLLLVFATGSASAQPDGTDCSPAPMPRAASPDLGPIYVSRDSVSCRLFSLQLDYSPGSGYNPYWTETGWSDIEALADLGMTVLFNYAVMTTPRVRVVEYFNRVLGHYFITSQGVESDLLDSGFGGPGWERTGHSFTAWHSTPRWSRESP